MKITVLLISIVLSGITRGCGGDASDPVRQKNPPVNTDISKDSIMHEQSAESIEIIILESFPVQVEAIFSGHFSNGCKRLHHHEVERKGNTFEVKLFNVSPREAFCTEALVPFTHRVRLDVFNLEKGTYIVSAGNITQSFILSVDNRLEDR